MNPEELLIHTDFIRRLAKSLVYDENTAEDIFQQTCLAALKRPPKSHHSLRGWFSKVTKNLVYSNKRSETRRIEREKASTIQGVMPSPEKIAAREEMRRRLVDTVLSLEDPFQSVIYLHYYEGLSLKEVARRAGIPHSTARGHLRRGLEKLREKLDKTHGGDRKQWIVSLAPFVGAPKAGPLALAMVSKLCLVAALVILFTTVSLWVFSSDTEDIPNRTATLENKEVERKISPLPTVENKKKVSMKIEPKGDLKEYEIKGVVLDDRTGQPVSGVLTLAMRPSVNGGYHYNKSMDTDKNGAFIFTGLKGAGLKITACHRDYDETCVEVNPAKKCQVIRLKKTQAFNIHGKAINELGQAVPRMGIFISGDHLAGNSDIVAVETDDQGRYCFENIPVGKISIMARQVNTRADIPFWRYEADSFTSLISNIRISANGKKTIQTTRTNEFDEFVHSINDAVFATEIKKIELVDRDLEINFGVSQDTVRWRGMIYDHKGEPAPKGVLLISPNNRSNKTRTQHICKVSKGHFKFSKIPIGTYAVRFLASNGSYDRYEIPYLMDVGEAVFSRPGDYDKDILLEKGEIRGVCINAMSGEPVHFFLSRWITAVLQDRRKRRFMAACNENGEFVFTGLPFGRYALFQDGEKHVGGEVVFANLSGKQPSKDVRIELPPMSHLSIDVKGISSKRAGYEGGKIRPSGYIKISFENIDNNDSYSFGPYSFWQKAEYFNRKETVYKKWGLDEQFNLAQGRWRVVLQGESLGTIYRTLEVEMGRKDMTLVFDERE